MLFIWEYKIKNFTQTWYVFDMAACYIFIGIEY